MISFSNNNLYPIKSKSTFFFSFDIETNFSVLISAFYGMEIPYGKREFIAEEEEQQQQAPQVAQPPLPPPVEEPSIQVTQENCHIPPHKMVVVQEQHAHVHPMVRRESLQTIIRILNLPLGDARKL